MSQAVSPTPSATTRVSIQWVRPARTFVQIMMSVLNADHVYIVHTDRGDVSYNVHNNVQESNEPDERTSTLVFTAPSGIFVDLRLLTERLTSVGHTDSDERQPISKIDWAFAGIITHRSWPSNRDLTESTWQHWVDSRTPDALNVRDTGVNSPMPNGDTRERGEMNDAAGILRGYEEVWRDVRVEPACATVFICFRGGSEAAARGVSMRVDTISPQDVCGVLVRVGSWCQGVLRDARGFTAERWELIESTLKDGVRTWSPVFRSGSGGIPCVRACTTMQLSGRESMELSAESGQWKCVELYEGGQTPNLVVCE